MKLRKYQLDQIKKQLRLYAPKTIYEDLAKIFKHIEAIEKELYELRDKLQIKIIEDEKRNAPKKTVLVPSASVLKKRYDP